MAVFHFDENEARAVGESIGISFDEIDLHEFQQGLGSELSEHGALDPETNVIGLDLGKAGKIAWEHLKEDPHYYSSEMKKNSSRDIFVEVAQALSNIEQPHEKERYYRDFLRRKRLLDRVQKNEGEVTREAFIVLTEGVADPVKKALLDHYVSDKKEGQMVPTRSPKTKMDPTYRTQVTKRIDKIMASEISLRSFRVGQKVYHPNFGTRAKIVEIDRDTLHLQEMDDDGNLLDVFRVVPREAFEAWKGDD